MHFSLVLLSGLGLTRIVAVSPAPLYELPALDVDQNASCICSAAAISFLLSMHKHCSATTEKNFLDRSTSYVTLLVRLRDCSVSDGGTCVDSGMKGKGSITLSSLTLNSSKISDAQDP